MCCFIFEFGGLGACLGGLSPPMPRMETGLSREKYGSSDIGSFDFFRSKFVAIVFHILIYFH